MIHIGRSRLFWSAINNWSSALLSFAIVVILARLLTPQDFGLVGLATAVVAVGSILTTDTVSAAIVQRQGLEDIHLQSAFWGMMALGTVVCGVAIALAPVVSNLFGDPRLTAVLRVISLRLIFDALSTVPFGLLTKRQDFKSLAFRSWISNGIAGIIGAALALAGAGVWALVIQQLAAGALNVGVCLPRTGWRPRFAFSLSHAYDLLPFSTYTMLSRACSFGNNYAVRLIIGNSLGVSDVGYYSFARRIYEMSSDSLGGVVISMAFPHFAEKQDRPAEIVSALFRSASRTSLVVFPAFLGLAAVAPDLIPLLFGAKWAPAIPVVQLFALRSILYASGGIHDSIIRARGKLNWWLAYNVGTALLTLCGSLIAVRYGLIAVALALFIIDLIVEPVVIFMIMKLVNFSLRGYLILFARPLVAAIGMALAVLTLRHFLQFDQLPASIKVLLELITGAVTYTALVVSVARTQAAEFIRYVFSRPSPA